MSRWNNADKIKPPVSEKFAESECLICKERDNSVPFVGWYNAKEDSWRVMHYKADSLPVRVAYWRDMVSIPKHVAAT